VYGHDVNGELEQTADAVDRAINCGLVDSIAPMSPKRVVKGLHSKWMEQQKRTRKLNVSGFF
jgi:hypothetical protein